MTVWLCISCSCHLAVVLLLLFSHPCVAKDGYNFLAGGAGQALYFDGDQADMLSFTWPETEAVAQTYPGVTIEFWLLLRDPYQNENAIFVYSAYDSEAYPAVASPLELALTFNTERKVISTYLRGEERACSSTACVNLLEQSQESWQHVSFLWSVEAGVNGSGVTQMLQLYHNGNLLWKYEDIPHEILIAKGQFAIGQKPSLFLEGYNELKAFTGLIDEFRLFLFKRTSEQIFGNFDRQLDPAAINSATGTPIFGYYFTFDEPSDGFNYDPDSWTEQISTITNYGSFSGADGYLGRSQALTNELMYETDRVPTAPTLPKFVFSQAPFVGNGNQDLMVLPNYLDMYISLKWEDLSEISIDVNAEVTVWLILDYETDGPTTRSHPLQTVSCESVATGEDTCTADSTGSKGPSGQLFQIDEDGNVGSEITFDPAMFGWGDFLDGSLIENPAVQVSNIARTSDWCGNGAGRLCPFGVIYRPNPSNYSSDLTYIHDRFKWAAYRPGYGDYRLNADDYFDKVSNIATVNIYEQHHYGISGAQDRYVTVNEDTASYVMHTDTADDGSFIKCKLRKLPQLGKLYRMGFEPGFPHVYGNMQTDISNLTAIATVPYVFPAEERRCALIYVPPADRTGDFIDVWYYTYLWTDNSESDEASVIISISSVNDPPNENRTYAKTQICSEYTNLEDYCILRMDPSVDGQDISVKLNTSDIDGSPVQSPDLNTLRSYFKIIQFPSMGEVYQQINPYGDQGDKIVRAPVFVGKGFAFAVLNGSSQRSECAEEFNCHYPYTCKTTECTFSNYHLSNIVGENDDRVMLQDTAQFDPLDRDQLRNDNEFIEVSLWPGDGTAIYVNLATIWEAANPGSVVKISSAPSYNGTSTKWRVIGEYEASIEDSQIYQTRVYTPDICPVPVPAAYFRIEASREDSDGYTMFPPAYDAVNFEGPVTAAAGMVTYEDFQPDGRLRDYGRIVYHPIEGLHSTGLFDRISYKTTDCQDWSPEAMEVVIIISPPQLPSAFATTNCTDGNLGPYDVAMLGTANDTCIEKWMDYVTPYGHYADADSFERNPDNSLDSFEKKFIQPDVQAIVEVPVRVVVKELFQVYGLNSTSQMCNPNLGTAVFVNSFGVKGRAPSTAFWNVEVNTTSGSQIVNDDSQKHYQLTPNGNGVNSTILGYGTRCANSAFDFNTRYFYAVDTQFKDQGDKNLLLDTWVGVVPDISYAGLYTVRVRQRLQQMCTYNLTHVQYFNGSKNTDSYRPHGVILPRESYNISGNCDDCHCNSTNTTDNVEKCGDRIGEPRYHDLNGVCTPCHLLSEETIDKIESDLYERDFFRDVCAILYTDCEAGRYFDKTVFYMTGSLELACPQCPPGLYQPTSNKDPRCFQCPIGTYYPSFGATNCLSCRFKSSPAYADFTGAISCTDCPRLCASESSSGCREWEAFTLELNKTHADAGRHVTDCVCKPGFFHQEGRVGEICEPCPDGGYCSGGLALPVPCGPGVYTNSSIIEITDDWTWQCVVEDGGYWANEGQVALFFQCEGDGCIGGQSMSVCKQQYSDRLCSRCADGYFGLGDIVCVKCLHGRFSVASILINTVSIMIVCCVWYYIGVILAGKYDSIDMLLLYMQVAALIQNFSLNWPLGEDTVSGLIYTYMHLIFDLVNFNVDFITPTCIMEWGYIHSFYLQMAFPVMMAGISFARYGYALWCNWFFGRGDSGWIMQTRPMMWLRGKLDYSQDKDRTKILLDMSMSKFLQFAVINFNILCERSFEVFECTTMEDGVQFLSAGPEVTCWSKDHYGMVGTACISLFVNVLGIPLTLLMIIKWAEKHDVMNQERFFNAFGWIYSRYEVEYNYWECIFLLRRFLMCLCVVFMADFSYIQASLGIGAITSMVGLQFYTRPFRVTSLDLLDSIALIQSIFYLVCGILFESSPRFGSDEYSYLYGNDFSLQIICFMTVLLVLCCALSLALEEIVDNKHGRIAADQIQERLVEALEGAGLTYNMDEDKEGKKDDEDKETVSEHQSKKMKEPQEETGVLSMEMFKVRLRILDPTMSDDLIEVIYEAMDDDGDGTVDFDEFRNHLWGRRRRMMLKQERKEMSVLAKLARYGTNVLNYMKYVFRRYSKKVTVLKRHTGMGDFSALGDATKPSGPHTTTELPPHVLGDLRRKMKMKMIAQTRKFNITLFGEVGGIVSGRKLRVFAEETVSDKAIIRFHQIDQWLSPAVADSSEIGMYATNNLVKLYRHLLDAWPFLVDWLATSSSQDRLAFVRMTDSMFACREVVGRKGLYARYITHGHRPAICLWLKDCSDEQQVIFWEMMHGIAAVNISSDAEEVKMKALQPFSMNHEDDMGNEKGNDISSMLKSQRVGKAAGMIFEFNSDDMVTKVDFTPTSVVSDAKNNLKELKIVGQAQVGKLLVAAGEMPQGVARCKFQWFRARVQPDGQMVMEIIPNVNMPHYTVTRADVGCKLRMVARPIFENGQVGKVATAITAHTVVDI